jgi:UTP pyrophosphatase
VFLARSVQHPDVPARVADQPGMLQLEGGLRHNLVPQDQHVGGAFLRHRQSVDLKAIQAHQPPAAALLIDRVIYDRVAEPKARHLKSTPPLAKAVYDQRLHAVRNALGTHTTVSRVQGTRLRGKREIRVSCRVKDAPAAFLRTIVVHRLAHLRERENDKNDKAFYALCTHMEPDYRQLEFDTRLWLTALEVEGRGGRAVGVADAPGRSEI